MSSKLKILKKNYFQAYYSKEKNSYITFDSKSENLNLPKERFIITPSTVYKIDSNNLIQNFKKFKKELIIQNYKRITCIVTIILNIYLNKTFETNFFSIWFSVFNNLNITFLPKIIYVINIITFFCIVTLIHDAYSTIKNKDQIKKYKSKINIQENLSTEHINLLPQKEAYNYLSYKSKKFIYKYIVKQNIDYNNLLSILCKKWRIKKLCKRSDLNTLKIISKINETKKDFKIEPADLISKSLEEALLTKSSTINEYHLLVALLQYSNELIQYLNKEEIYVDTLREALIYTEKLFDRKYRNFFWNLSKPYYMTGGLGKYWIYGYTYYLDQFSTDITSSLAKQAIEFGEVHKKEIEEITAIVGRMSNKNVLLIGDVGVGKSSIIKGLAQNIAYGRVPEQLIGKRIVQLDITKLIAQGIEQGNIEDLIQKSMDELEKAGNTILFIDEIQEIIPTKSEQTGTSISSMMLSYILESKFPIIGTINFADYKRYFYESESIRQSFENINIPPVSVKESLHILETKVENLEKHYLIHISISALIKTVELSERYVTERKLPDSAVRTIESACSWAQSQNIKNITPEIISKYISLQTGIPLQNLTKEESTNLSNLKERIKSKVIGQEEAVHKICESIKRARTDIRDSNKPIGVFMFMGPSGVGKTYLAQTLYKEYFGNNKGIIRVDMSEYQSIDSIQKFLGSYNTNINDNQQAVTLIDKIKANPFTVVLFDEIEKAHPQILDLFLQLFDEGRLTSNKGETVDFTNTIIITTSNIGSNLITQNYTNKTLDEKEIKDIILKELHKSLRTELINRYDDIIIFSSLSFENRIEIARLLLEELKERVSKKGIILNYNKDIPSILATNSNIPGMGARPLKRVIKKQIDSKIADLIINQNNSEILIDKSWFLE